MPADIKLLSTHLCSNTVKHNHRKPPPKASSPSSAQDTEQALPCNTHTATQSKPYSPCPCKSTPSLHFVSKQQKSCSPDTAPGLEVVSLPAEAAKASAPEEPGEAVPAAISQHLLHCFSAEWEWLLSPGTHGSLSRRALYSAQFSSKVSACGGELPVLGTGGFWLQRLLTLSIASGGC